MRASFIGLAVLLVLSGCGDSSSPSEPIALAAPVDSSQTEATPDPTCTDDIVVETPTPHTMVDGELQIGGQARGTWFFEGSFPAYLLDAELNELAVIPVPAEGEWMTEDFVPFSATLPVVETEATLGYVFLQKDNPSDELRLSCSVIIPVRF